MIRRVRSNGQTSMAFGREENKGGRLGKTFVEVWKGNKDLEPTEKNLIVSEKGDSVTPERVNTLAYQYHIHLDRREALRCLA